MEIIFVYEKEGLRDVVSQVKYKVVDMIDTALNLLNPSKTENLILPIVPKIKFPNCAKVDTYEGLTANYNIPSKRGLDTIEWSSFFPVNKSYSFQHIGSNNNGYDYVRFLQRRLQNQYPFRLIAYENNTVLGAVKGIASDTINNNVSMKTASNLIEVIFDGIVIVKDFNMNVDNVGDIEYSLKLKQFVDANNPLIDWASLTTGIVTNMAVKTTNSMLKNAGLI